MVPWTIDATPIFVPRNLTEYEYRIYSKKENWIFVFEYVISSAFYLNIRIYSCYTDNPIISDSIQHNNNSNSLTFFKSGWDFTGQDGKNLATKSSSLRQSFEQKTLTFVVILYQKDEILQKYLTNRSIILFHKEILWKKVSSCHRAKFPDTGGNFPSQDEVPFQRKKNPFKGRDFLPQEETSCHRKTFPQCVSHSMLYPYLYWKCIYIHYYHLHDPKLLHFGSNNPPP